MGLGDALGYLSYANPLHACTKILSAVGLSSKKIDVVQKFIPPDPLWKMSIPYIHLAALSGATAIFLKTYYSKKHYITKQDERRNMFDEANIYHFINTVPLIALPMCRKSNMAAFLIIFGQILYCGPRYYYAITGNKVHLHLNGNEEYLLICGWLSMLL